ncbi:MAG: DUF445 family protein [Desulfohalobiaceae bacterium]|nr:DUF445 family protein [Desulfohalobiaceae bacterium]
MHIVLFLSPLLGAFIGWMTNYLAIRMLFHPRQPVRIGFWTWQGLFPKRQEELAAKLGEIVENELVNHSDIQRVLGDPEFQARLRDTVRSQVDEFVDRKVTRRLPTILASTLRGSVLERFKTLLVREVEQFIPEMVERAGQELEYRVRFSHIVQDKVRSFSIDKLEEVLFSIMKREFRFIEVLGGLLGLIIGLFQLGAFYAMG